MLDGNKSKDNNDLEFDKESFSEEFEPIAQKVINTVDFSRLDGLSLEVQKFCNNPKEREKALEKVETAEKEKKSESTKSQKRATTISEKTVRRRVSKKGEREGT